MNFRKLFFGKNRTAKGITLVALVITIIVLLILAGISLNLVMGEGGILTRATNARKTNNIAGVREKVELEFADYSQEYLTKRYVNQDSTVGANMGAYILGKLPINGDGYTVTRGTGEEANKITITLTDGTSTTGTIDNNSGKVAWEGVNTNGTPSGGDSGSGSTNTATNTSTNTTSNTTSNTTENTTGGGSTGTTASTSTSYVGYYANVDGVWGIIYADLQKGVPNSSPWGNSNGAYTLPTLGQNESYKSYTVSALPSTSGPTTFGGYTSANSNTGVISLASGSTGKDRFYVMTTTDESGTYTWANACAKTAGTTNKWVLPTKEQWSMFGSAFSITTSNYGTGTGGYGLNYYYWSSTESNTNGAWRAYFYDGCMDGDIKTSRKCVRLSTTF